MSKTKASSVCRQLHGLFNEPPRATIKSISQDLKKERKLERLVHKFKKSSQNDTFRCHPSMYDRAVRRLASAKRFSWIEDILESQKQYKSIHNEGFNARLITLYGKSGMYEHARKVFDEMPERNCARTVLSFNALLAACVNAKKFEDVPTLFRELPGELGIEPDSISYGTVIKAVCEVGCFDLGVSLLFEMEKRGLKANVVNYNTLLDGLYVNRKFAAGERIWGLMLEKNVQPNVVSYTSRLIGFGLEKRSGDAVGLVEEMRKIGAKPDAVFFEALIKIFAVGKNLEEVKRLYGETAMKNCKLRKSAYAVLISLACEKGDSGFAFELAKDLFRIKCVVDEALLQQVVDELVKESKIEEAEKVVRLGKDNGYCLYKLKMP